MAGDYTPNPALLFSQPPAGSGNLVFAQDGGCAPYAPSAALVFDAAPTTSASLVFSCEGGGDGGDAPLEIALAAQLPAPTLTASVAPHALPSLAGVLPAPTLAATVYPHALVQVAATLPPPTLSATAQYASNTARPTVGKAGTAWQQASAAQTGHALAHQNTQPAPAGFTAAQQQATPSPAGFKHGLPPVFAPMWAKVLGVFQNATPAHAGKGFAHQDATRTPLSMLGVWQNATPLHRSALFRHQEANRLCRASRRAKWQNAHPVQRGQWGRVRSAQPLPHYWWALWQAARPPQPGHEAKPPKPPIPPCYTPSGVLVFADAPATNAHLLFACPGAAPQPPATIVIATKRFYMVQNTLTLERQDTGAQILATAFSMSLDADSWTWRWSATVPDAMAHLLGRQADGQPATVIATINGVEYALLLEKTQRSRQFLPTTWSISGRGISALLDSPYAPAQTFSNASAINAQQLAGDILTVNGVPLGWDVAWQIDDWNCPAGVWSVQGSYMAALADMAAAVGAMLQPHNTDKTVVFMPRYPAPYWAWGDLTPDIELPDAVVVTEGNEYEDRPNYDRVHVGGTGAGVFGPFTRAGTAGLVLAPQASHALIGDAAAHRMRGIAELSAGGKQERVTLSLPVLAETGLIRPGKLLRYNASGGNTSSSARSVLGMVRGLQMSWRESGAMQTIELEVHHDE